jgi:hypothetical protein
MITRAFRGIRAHKLISWLMVAFALVKVVLLIYLLAGDPRYAVGRSTSFMPVRGTGALVRVEAPMLSDRLVLLRAKSDEPPAPGRWLLAVGEPVKVGRWQVLDAQHVRVLPVVPAVLTTAQDWWSLPLPEVLEQHRAVALLLGATILLLGFVFMRLAAGVALGCAVAFIAWHAAVYASFQRWVELSDELLRGVVVLSFVIGAVVGYRGANIIAYLAQRLAVILILVATLDDVASYFGWPLDLTRIVGVLGTIISPAIGLWMVASYLLALGLKAQGAGINLVLGATAVAIHVLTRGAWIPGRSLYRRWSRRPRGRVRARAPEISLAELVRE